MFKGDKKGLFLLGFIFLSLIFISAFSSAFTRTGSVCTCNSCSDCTSALNNNQCRTINMIASVSSFSTTNCIAPNRVANKVLDCQGNSISKGSSSSNPFSGAIYFSSAQNMTVKNCLVNNAQIYLNGNGSNTFYNNTLVDGYLLMRRFAGLSQAGDDYILNNKVSQFGLGIILSDWPGCLDYNFPSEPASYGLARETKVIIQGNTLSGCKGQDSLGVLFSSGTNKTAVIKNNNLTLYEVGNVAYAGGRYYAGCVNAIGTNSLSSSKLDVSGNSLQGCSPFGVLLTGFSSVSNTRLNISSNNINESACFGIYGNLGNSNNPLFIENNNIFANQFGTTSSVICSNLQSAPATGAGVTRGIQIDTTSPLTNYNLITNTVCSNFASPLFSSSIYTPVPSSLFGNICDYGLPGVSCARDCAPYRPNQPSVCTDSDNGFNITVVGTAANATRTATDSCINSNTVNESVCSGSAVGSVVQSCGVGLQCFNGRCASCIDQCTLSANQCSGSNIQACITNVSSGCTIWNTPSSCPVGQTCSGNSCINSCTNQCTLGNQQCSGNGVQTCITNVSSSCTIWGGVSACSATQTCVASGNVASCVCTPNVQCGAWDVCNAGRRTRTCTDANACGNLPFVEEDFSYCINQCSLASAFWQPPLEVSIGDRTFSNVTGNSACEGLLVGFNVFEYDLGSYTPALIDPVIATFVNGKAGSPWIAEWLDDGFLSGDPEYFFDVFLIANISNYRSSDKSASELLEVDNLGTPAVCGNGIIEGSEECDGSNLNSQTCVSKGYSSGALSCTASCAFNVTQCLTSANSCSDTDGGILVDIAGIATNNSIPPSCVTSCIISTITLEDRCIDANTINESSCSGTAINRAPVSCSGTDVCIVNPSGPDRCGPAACVPDCTNKYCGQSNGCSGVCGSSDSCQQCTDNSQCDSGQTCETGQCTSSGTIDRAYWIDFIDGQYAEITASNINQSVFLRADTTGFADGTPIEFEIRQKVILGSDIVIDKVYSVVTSNVAGMIDWEINESAAGLDPTKFYFVATIGNKNKNSDDLSVTRSLELISTDPTGCDRYKQQTTCAAFDNDVFVDYDAACGATINQCLTQCSCVWDTTAPVDHKCVFRETQVDSGGVCANAGVSCDENVLEQTPPTTCDETTGLREMDVKRTIVPAGGSYPGCVDGTTEIPCGQSKFFELPFFNWVNGLAAILIIIALYLIIFKKKKVSKKSRRK